MFTSSHFNAFFSVKSTTSDKVIRRKAFSFQQRLTPVNIYLYFYSCLQVIMIRKIAIESDQDNVFLSPLNLVRTDLPTQGRLTDRDTNLSDRHGIFYSIPSQTKVNNKQQQTE